MFARVAVGFVASIFPFFFVFLPSFFAFLLIRLRMLLRARLHAFLRAHVLLHVHVRARLLLRVQPRTCQCLCRCLRLHFGVQIHLDFGTCLFISCKCFQCSFFALVVGISLFFDAVSHVLRATCSAWSKRMHDRKQWGQK